MAKIRIKERVLSANDEIALANRKFLKSKKVFAFNILSSPGSGKTSILEKTLERLSGKMDIHVLVGDVQTDNDAKRLKKYCRKVKQIVTGGACHLEAKIVRDYLKRRSMDKADMLIIENVGNLICPSSYDLGEHKRVVMLSVTEGDDKPKKYPAMFRSSDALIINKTDLLKMTNFNIKKAEKNALNINPKLKVFRTSCVTGEGLDDWFKWLEKCLKK